MGERVLVLSADVWSMPDEKTGELMDGVSVWFVNDYRDDTPQAIGFKPTKISVPSEKVTEIFNSFKKNGLPGIYEFSHSSRPGAQGKATLMLRSVDFVELVSLFGA